MAEDDESKRPRLGYWNMRCIGEPIRLLLTYAGVTFEDVRCVRAPRSRQNVQHESLPALHESRAPRNRYDVGPPPLYDKSSWYGVKNDLGLSIPNLPYYIDPHTGTRLTQTHAILRFLGERHGLAGETEQQRALAQMAQEAMRDMMYDFFDVTYCSMGDTDGSLHRQGASQCAQTSPKFEERKAAYLTGKLNVHLACFARMLRSAEGGAMWIAGTVRPTYADFQLAEYLDQVWCAVPPCAGGSRVRSARDS